MIAECYSKIEKLYEIVGEKAKCIEILKKKLKLCEEDKDDKKTCKTHLRLASVLIDCENEKEGEKHLEAAENIAKQEKNLQL